jgi:ABC-type multidrug transport system fused ATPase/permease subunit
MGTVMIVLAVQWPCFLVITGYLDQVLDTGNGLPRHPLFFLGYDYAIHASADNDTLAATHDSEGLGGVMTTTNPPDVQAEEERMRRMVAAGGEGMDAVIVRDIAKTFPGKGGIGVVCAKTLPGKIAVRTLSMGVAHGECFGMLDPNGAGKTTTINMLVGMFPPTSGTATVEGLYVRTDMNRIYTLMGVCPQHDILWDTLSPKPFGHLYRCGRSLEA